MPGTVENMQTGIIMSAEEYEARKEYKDRIHHAKVVAETLAQDPSFIISLGKTIVYQMKEEGLMIHKEE